MDVALRRVHGIAMLRLMSGDIPQIQMPDDDTLLPFDDRGNLCIMREKPRTAVEVSLCARVQQEKKRIARIVCE